ncbi:alginate lyase family protein [Halomarina pelagica]|uniref:alginate lyase family protein n=1 Tax=Halomarina pelagica TaxID=2961599 RepID=UPI0020C2AB95|nr:alginate lyase family protein [Halomarina sp. BND7]
MDNIDEVYGSQSRRGYLKLVAAAAASATVGTAATSGTVGRPASTAGLPTGESRPALFAHLDELAGVKRQVDAGAEPWASAYEEFIADVNASLEAEPRSVTDNDNSHTFDTGGPGSGTRGDYTAAIEMGDRIRDLGLAYQFTGEDRYAARAVELLDHWFLDPATKMRPKVTDGIELYITIPKMWYGAELVRDHPAWSGSDVGSQADLEQWTATFLETLPTGVPEWIQNIFIWREVCRAAGAAYIGDTHTLERAFEHVRADGFVQLREDGLLANEIERYDGLGYSMFALKAYVTMAELGRHYGQDLYSYEKYGTPAIKCMFDGYVEYVLNPDRFDEKYGAGNGFTAREREEGTSAYELAYSRWQEAEYLDVITSRGSEIKNEPTYVQQHQDAINSKGRPVRDERLLGWTTLSHGNLFAIGSSDAPETPEDPGTAEEHHLLIESKETSPYRFAVSGDLTFDSRWGTEDGIEGDSVSSVLAGGADAYRFTGVVTDFEIDGPATIELDGEPVTPEELRSMGGSEGSDGSASDGSTPDEPASDDPPSDGSDGSDSAEKHYLLVESGEVSPYHFTVSGHLTFDSRWGTEDAIEGGSARGVLAGGGDAYRFTGVVTDFEIDGPATIELDGEPVTPEELRSMDGS